MNRKQEVAITSGAVVIALLVLFPPWSSQMIRINEWGTEPAQVKFDVGCGFHPRFGTERQRQAWAWDKWIELREDGVRVWGTPYLPDVNEGLGLVLVSAALVLTVAAVLVLKDRKPAA